MFTTKVGKEFSFDQIDQVMAYASPDGSKAVLLA